MSNLKVKGLESLEIECPKCQKYSEYGTRFCDECGYAIHKIQIEIDTAIRKMKEKNLVDYSLYKHCKNCKDILPISKSVCYSCKSIDLQIIPLKSDQIFGVGVVKRK